MVIRSALVGLLGLLVAQGSFSGQVKAADAELVMFSSGACVYCKIFNREVRPNYRWSDAAHRAPLRQVDLDRRGTGGYSLKYDITVTPTFVLFQRGREVSRINGYPGKKRFYSLVGHMLKKAK
jgi:thioredoxin-related protein